MSQQDYLSVSKECVSLSPAFAFINKLCNFEIEFKPAVPPLSWYDGATMRIKNGGTLTTNWCQHSPFLQARSLSGLAACQHHWIGVGRGFKKY